MGLARNLITEDAFLCTFVFVCDFTASKLFNTVNRPNTEKGFLAAEQNAEPDNYFTQRSNWAFLDAQKKTKVSW